VRATLAALAGTLVLAGGAATARADEPAGDDKKPADAYCQWATNVAQASADIFDYPTLVGSVAYVKEPNLVNNQVVSGARTALLLQWNLIGILEGSSTKAHGDYDCKRHQALDRVAGETSYKALKAKLKVYEGAQEQAEKILEKIAEDVKAHRTNVQELVATRVRVNELRDLESDTRKAMDALPRASKDEQMGGALAEYYKYDGLMEKEEGRLRRLQGINVTISAGPDLYLDKSEAVPVTALFSIGINLGVFAAGHANESAADGRRRLVRDQHQVALVDTTIAHIQDELKTDQQRAGHRVVAGVARFEK
jgi:hypothetical protein